MGIETAQNEQNALTLDPSIESTKREIKIVKLTTDTMLNINDNELVFDMEPISYSMDSAAAINYILSIGEVLNGLDAPTLNVTEITSDSALVTIECDNKLKVKDGMIYNIR